MKGFKVKDSRSSSSSNAAWDMANYRYDVKRRTKAGAAWALQRARYNRRH